MTLEYQVLSCSNGQELRERYRNRLGDDHQEAQIGTGLIFLKTNFELKRLFYTIVVGATFSVNVFNDSIFKLGIFSL